MSESSVIYKPLPALSEIDPGIVPCDVSVLVLPMMLEEKTKGGIILTSNVKERDDAAAMEGLLVSVSAAAWQDTTPELPIPVVGSIVFFARYAGVDVRGRDGRMYRLLNDRDIKAVVEFDRSRGEGVVDARIGHATRLQAVGALA